MANAHTIQKELKKEIKNLKLSNAAFRNNNAKLKVDLHDSKMDFNSLERANKEMAAKLNLRSNEMLVLRRMLGISESPTTETKHALLELIDAKESLKKDTEKLCDEYNKLQSTVNPFYINVCNALKQQPGIKPEKLIELILDGFKSGAAIIDSLGLPTDSKTKNVIARIKSIKADLEAARDQEDKNAREVDRLRKMNLELQSQVNQKKEPAANIGRAFALASIAGYNGYKTNFLLFNNIDRLLTQRASLAEHYMQFKKDDAFNLISNLNSTLSNILGIVDLNK